jgi:hypothetical protein
MANTLRKAQPGLFRVRVKYFSSNRSRATTRTKVYVTVVERWGAPAQLRMLRTVSLVDGKEMHEVADVRVGGR